MKLDLFILGCVSEKPSKVKNLLEIAEEIKMNKWLSFSIEKIIERLEILNEMGYITTYDKNDEAVEKKYFSSTELGIEHLHENLKSYIKSNESDMGMIILFLMFSSHLSKLEIISLIEKKIELLKIKIERTFELKKVYEEGQVNKIRELSLLTLLNFRKTEISIYEDLLKYAKDHETWSDFLALEDKFEYSL